MLANDQPSPRALELMILGFHLTQVIHVGAKLGVAEQLKDGPKTSEQVATALKTDPRATYRLLRAMARVGVLEEVDPGEFALTDLGEYLRPDVPGSLHGLAVYYGDKFHWDAWRELDYSVQTGETAFDHIFNMSVWDYFAKDPDAARVFNQAMTARSALVVDEIARAYDFSRFKTLVDVGGGQGKMLSTILQATPGLHGILFDQPQVVEGAPSILEEAGVTDRCQVIGGSFLEEVPVGGDAYMLSRTIHNWQDDKAETILKNVHRAMAPGGRLLIVERLFLPDREWGLFTALSDLNMLVTTTGGVERDENEFRQLYAAAGFELTRVIPIACPYGIVEGTRG